MTALEKYNYKLYSNLQEELQLYSEMGIIPIRKISGALQSARNAINHLRQFILVNPFESEAEEAMFFKTIKPKYTGEQIFLVEMATLQTSRTALTETALLEFYEAERRKVQEFFEHYRYLYQYFLMNAAELDSKLFLRNAPPMETLPPEAVDSDPQFSSNGDYLWAKFIAYERLREWLEEEVIRLTGDGGSGVGGGPDTGGGPVLKWTGETINLAEIAYGIWLTGQVNNGNASISEIVLWLERHFAVRIGKAHRRWQNIAGRKRLSYTRYIDEIKVAIEKRVEEEFSK